MFINIILVVLTAFNLYLFISLNKQRALFFNLLYDYNILRQIVIELRSKSIKANKTTIH